MVSGCFRAPNEEVDILKARGAALEADKRALLQLVVPSPTPLCRLKYDDIRAVCQRNGTQQPGINLGLRQRHCQRSDPCDWQLQRGLSYCAAGGATASVPVNAPSPNARRTAGIQPIQPFLRCHGTVEALDDAINKLDGPFEAKKPIIAIPESVMRDHHETDADLLEILGNIAEGGDEDGGDISEGIVDFLPLDVQMEDPSVKSMIRECGLVWSVLVEEQEHHVKFNNRKLAELNRAMEHKREVQEESESLLNRLHVAESTLSGRLEEERISYLRFQASLKHISRENGVLRSTVKAAVDELVTQEANAKTSIRRGDAEHVQLLQELKEATKLHARLESEHDAAKVVASGERQRSLDMEALQAVGEPARHEQARLWAQLREATERRLPFDVGSSMPLDSVFPRIPDVVEDSANEDVLTFRMARLTRRCANQEENLKLLRERLALDIAAVEVPSQSLCQWHSSSRDAATHQVNSASWRTEMGNDLAKAEDEVFALCESLSGIKARTARVVSEEQETRNSLQDQLFELSDLQERLLTAEDAYGGNDSVLVELNEDYNALHAHCLSERETLLEVEEISEQRRESLRAQVEDQFRKLSQARAHYEDLYQTRRRKKNN